MSSYTLNTSRQHSYRLRQRVAIVAADPDRPKYQISSKPGRITGIINLRRHTSSSTPIFQLHDGLITGDDAVSYPPAATPADEDSDDTIIARIVQSALDGLAGFTGASMPYDNLAITFPPTLPADQEYLILYEDNS